MKYLPLCPRCEVGVHSARVFFDIIRLVNMSIHSRMLFYFGLETLQAIAEFKLYEYNVIMLLVIHLMNSV